MEWWMHTPSFLTRNAGALAHHHPSSVLSPDDDDLDDDDDDDSVGSWDPLSQIA